MKQEDPSALQRKRVGTEWVGDKGQAMDQRKTFTDLYTPDSAFRLWK